MRRAKISYLVRRRQPVEIPTKLHPGKSIPFEPRLFSIRDRAPFPLENEKAFLPAALSGGIFTYFSLSTRRNIAQPIRIGPKQPASLIHTDYTSGEYIEVSDNVSNLSNANVKEESIADGSFCGVTRGIINVRHLNT